MAQPSAGVHVHIHASAEPSLMNASSNICRQHSTSLRWAPSLRGASDLAIAKKAAAAKTSSFGLLALQEKLSFRHWSMIDATSTEIKLLVADVVAYKWSTAASMIAKLWHRYVFQTKAETLIGASASPTKPMRVRTFEFKHS